MNTRKLSEICHINPKIDSNISDMTEVSFIPMSSVSVGGGIDVNQIKEFKEVRKGFTCFLDGDVLFAKITPCMENGKGALAKNLKNGIGFGSTEFHVLRPRNKEIKSEWVYYLLHSKQFRNIAARNMTGTAGQKRVPSSYLENFRIPVPSLQDQKQIVQILDAADTLRKKRKEQLNLLDDYLKSVFFEMFGDPVTNNKNISQKKIGDVGEVVTGNTPSRQKKEYYGNFIEWIKSDNINSPEFVLTKAEEFLSNIGAEVGRVAPKESVLVTCIAGSPDCIGNSAISDRKVAFNQQINAFVPGKEIKTEFFFAQLYICKRLVQQASTESMKGMVSKSRFSEIKILVPSIEKQLTFVKIFNSIAKIRNKMRTSLDEMDNHFNALMQRFFG